MLLPPILLAGLTCLGTFTGCESTPEIKRHCLTGDCETGQGALVWFVKRYEGEFQDGLMHGRGVMQYSDGRFYTGQWNYGREEGEGEMIWPDGKRYHGQWRGGAPHGRGVLTMPDGYRFEGLFENGYFVRR
jgi:hypothetical protein